MKKKIRQIPVEGYPIISLTNNPQNSQGHQKQEKSERLSQPRGTPKNITKKCKVMSWIGFWNRERTLSKN